MISGRIIKSVGGFYEVKSQEMIYECKARGLFRNENIKPLVGDFVKILVSESNKGTIMEIETRKNQLIRPPVANIDQCIIVSSYKNPKINFLVLDKLIIAAEYKEIDVVLCFSKEDLVSSDEINQVTHYYEASGYPMVSYSIQKEKGLEKLNALMKGKVNVLAGPSGVGKSTLINGLKKELALEVGEISQKNKRGKHTTRHVELCEIDETTYVFDTPGFTAYELEGIEKQELSLMYPEFIEPRESCQYRDCTHINEQHCGVKKKMAEGHINPKRYENYVKLYEVIDKNSLKSLLKIPKDERGI